jgi:hypothetical protein
MFFKACFLLLQYSLRLTSRLHRIDIPILVSFIFAVHSSALASIISINDTSFAFLGVAKDGYNITVDLKNRTEWLDFDLTSGRSYNSISSDLLEGRPLAGWRYATAVEFSLLASSAGIDSQFIDRISGQPSAELIRLSRLLGQTSTNRNSGIFNEPGFGNANNRRLGGIMLDTVGDGSFSNSIYDIPNDPQVAFNQTWFKDDAYDFVGSALVRNSNVPEPNSIAIFFAFMCILRKCKSKRKC